MSFVTLAYPTSVTDADGYSSSVRYNYDFGAATWKQTPLPNTTANTPGPSQKLAYDTIGRLQRITNLVNNAYTLLSFPVAESCRHYPTIRKPRREQCFVIGRNGRVLQGQRFIRQLPRFSGQRTQYDIMVVLKIRTRLRPRQRAPWQWAATGDDPQPVALTNRPTTGRPTLSRRTGGSNKEQAMRGGCDGGQW